MKKKSIKVIALVMSFVFILGAGWSVPASAASIDANKILYNASDVLVNGLVSVIAAFIPKPQGWVDEASYKSENVPEGTKTFLDKPAENAKWSLGYAQDSIIKGQEVIGDSHYVSGGISLSPKYPTKIVDDLKVRVIALNDGSGRGTTVFAVLDAYGLANNDVREIRSRIADYAKKNNIVSVNVAVLHQHSAVDTFGMNGDIVKAVLLNPIINLVNGLSGKKVIDTHNGKNDTFQDNLFNVTVKTIKTAVEGMETGTLKFGTVDYSEYIRDKRAPYDSLDTNLNRFRFIPDNQESKETWFSTSVIHCVGNGVQKTEITADYPYYMEKYINENENVNFMLLMGAELATSQNYDTFTEEEKESDVKNYMILGEKLGKRLTEVENEQDVAPLLNITHKEITFEIENKIMYLAAKAGLFENQAIETKDGLKVVSEIGYCEIGTNLAVALIPGELEASIAYGNSLDASESWTGTDWKYDTMQKVVGENRKLLVFGLCNDQIGYIVPSNDYMPMLVPESKSIEFVSLGSKTSDTYMDEFISLVKSK